MSQGEHILFIRKVFKGKTQNHALYKAVRSLGYNVFIYLSLVTNTSYKHIQTIYQNDHTARI